MAEPPELVLSRRVVAVIGGGGRLAPFLARRLLDNGAAVALVDANADALTRVTGELAAVADRVSSYTADVTEEVSVDAAFGALLARFGRLDGLVYAVNTHATGSLEDMPVETWRRALDGHLTGNFLCLRAAIEALRRSRGAIVNVASVYALVAPIPVYTTIRLGARRWSTRRPRAA